MRKRTYQSSPTENGLEALHDFGASDYHGQMLQDSASIVPFTKNAHGSILLLVMKNAAELQEFTTNKIMEKLLMLAPKSQKRFNLSLKTLMPLCTPLHSAKCCILLVTWGPSQRQHVCTDLTLSQCHSNAHFVKGQYDLWVMCPIPIHAPPPPVLAIFQFFFPRQNCLV